MKTMAIGSMLMALVIGGTTAMTATGAEPEGRDRAANGPAESAPVFALATATAESDIWKDGVGNGFLGNTFQAGFALGAGFGVKTFGGRQAHDLAESAVSFGWIFSDVVGDGHWYRGNWELVGELFGGAQFQPDNRYFVGIAPLLRYDFATGSRWVPFVNAGAGLSGTDIRGPDLSTPFEFNVQFGAGTHYLLRDAWALTLQYRWLHFSNAYLDTPNLSTNTQMFLAGLTWFF